MPITGLVFDSSKYASCSVEMEIRRKSDLEDICEKTELLGFFVGGSWSISQGISNANSGVTFTVDSAGQVLYQSSEQAGEIELQEMSFRTTTMGAVGG
jgi:hypothetical protein